MCHKIWKRAVGVALCTIRLDITLNSLRLSQDKMLLKELRSDVDENFLCAFMLPRLRVASRTSQATSSHHMSTKSWI